MPDSPELSSVCTKPDNVTKKIPQNVPLLSAFPFRCLCKHTALEVVGSISSQSPPWSSPAPEFPPPRTCKVRPHIPRPRPHHRVQRYRLVPTTTSATQPETAAANGTMSILLSTKNVMWEKDTVKLDGGWCKSYSGIAYYTFTENLKQ